MRKFQILALALSCLILAICTMTTAPRAAASPEENTAAAEHEYKSGRFLE